MTIFSIITISTALFEVPTGIFSDMIGRRNTIILGAATSVVFTALYALALNFWILALAALLEGLATSFYSGNNEAFLYDTLLEEKQEHRYAEFLGKTSKMFQIALAISSVSAIVFLFNNQFRIVFWISVIPQIICLFLAFFLREPAVHSKKSGNIYEHLKEAFFGFIHNRKLRMLSLTSIVGYGVGEATFKFNAAFINTVWPTWAIPIARTLSYIGAALSFHYAGRTLKRFNTLKVLLVGNLYTRAIYALAVIFPSMVSPVLMSSTSIFYGTLTVGRGSLMQKEFKQEQRATMGSLDSFAGNILFGVIAIMLGIFADKFSPAIAILAAQFIQVFNSYIYWKLLKEGN
jgi:MFS family permease